MEAEEEEEEDHPSGAAVTEGPAVSFLSFSVFLFLFGALD